MSKRKFKFFVLVLSLPFCLLAQVKVGYVDSNEIINSLDEVRQVQVDLEKEQRRLENEMNDLMIRLDSLNQDYERQRLLMSESRRQEKENDLRKLKENIQTFQMEKFGPEGEIYSKQTKLLKPVLKKINEAIEKVGSERSYDLILDAQTGGIVYALESHNLTEDVLEELSKSTGSVTE